jgi:hypothetical protein
VPAVADAVNTTGLPEQIAVLDAVKFTVNVHWLYARTDNISKRKTNSLFFIKHERFN